MKKSWLILLIGEGVLILAASVLAFGILTGRFGDLFSPSSPEQSASAQAGLSAASHTPVAGPADRPLITADLTLEDGVLTVSENLTFTETSDTLRAYLFAVNYADVTMTGVGADAGVVGYSFDGPNLIVRLKQPGASLRLAYTVVLPRDDSIMAARENLILITNALGTPAVEIGGSPFTAYLHPEFGSPLVYPETDYRVTIRAEQSYSLYGPGKEAETVSDGWREAEFFHEKLRDLPLVACRGISVVSGESGGVPVTYIGSEDCSAFVDSALAAATEDIGPYPYSSLTVVRVPALTGAAQQGMEFSGMILLRDSLFTAASVDSLKDVAYHELFHQWFYGAVGVNKMTEPAIDEGLCTFLAGWLTGRPVEGELVPLSIFSRQLKDYSNVNEFYSEAYNAPARYWGALYQNLGEDGFFAFLRRIYHEYNGEILAYEDLTALLGEVS